MNDLEISFGAAPWEEYLETVSDVASATTLLTLMEGESEESFEDALFALEQRSVMLDIADLPKPAFAGEGAVRLRHEMQLAAKGLKVSDLEPGDPLRLYLEEVAMTPAFGNEQLLAEQSASGDETAQVALTNLGLSRVIALAQGYTGHGVLLLDLIQEGSLGLWQAVQNFRMGEYVAHRDWWIQFYLAKAVTIQARESGVGQKMRSALEDYKSVDERLLAELGRNPSVEEIAEAMHISPEAAATVGKMLENARRLQQAKKEPDPEEEQEAQEQAVEDTAYFQTRQRVNEMLSGLDELEATIISLRFGLEGGMPLSPEDTGRKLGLTPNEVAAKEAAAMIKMRKK